MEETIGGPGRMMMRYNYMTSDHKVFRINEVHDYEKVIKIPKTNGCGCAGDTNIFYVVKGSRIPVNRAVPVNS
jgi:hypothetical protein